MTESAEIPRSPSHQLSRTLREHDLLYLFVGSVIGSGIFVTPGLILRQLGGSVGYSLLVWLVGGILSLLGALTYAELAAANPEAGGLYCYIRDGFGRMPAFLYGWCLFLVIASATIAALAHAFTAYLGEVIPLSPEVRLVVVWLVIAVVTAVNVWGTRKSANLQNDTTLIKVGIVVVLSCILLVLGLANGNHSREIASSFRGELSGSSLLSAFGFGMIAVLWAYEGWQFGTYSAGEVINPQKSFPRAFLFGSVTLMGLYLFAVLAYLIALGPAAASATDTIAAAAATQVLGKWAGKLVAITILVSTFSAANSVMLTSPRVFFAMANDKLFFKKLADVHPRFGTPANAVIALGVWSAVLASFGGFVKLASGAIFIGWIFYGLGAASIFPIRRANLGKALPYRVPGYPFTPLVFVLVAVAIIGNPIYAAIKDPQQFSYLLVAIVLLLLGMPAYFFWSRQQGG
ncbi:MAG TPA: amino acid permease [Candidatus Acidoferrum sp.]|jgi:APA family basic amino acid/polyamine antiporter